jgi:hypothetical protein
MIGAEKSLSWRQRSGNAAGPIICIGSAEKSMTFTRRNRRGIFGRTRLEAVLTVSKCLVLTGSARVIFSKIEQVPSARLNK